MGWGGRCLRKGIPLASRVAHGVSGPSSSCVWNPRVFADDARAWPPNCLIPPPHQQEPPPPGALLPVSPSLCSLSFVFLEDRAFIFLPRDRGRVGALGAWHCAHDLGREGQGRGLGGSWVAGEAGNSAESSWGPAPFHHLSPELPHCLLLRLCHRLGPLINSQSS